MCSQCDFLGNCQECMQGFYLNPDIGQCQSNCAQKNYYLNLDKQLCQPICDYGYQESKNNFICVKNQKCSLVQEYGINQRQIIDSTLVGSDFIVLCQSFNSTSSKYSYFLRIYDQNLNFKGEVQQLNDAIKKYYYDENNNIFITCSLTQIIFWQASTWKVKRIDLLSNYVSTNKYVVFLDQNYLILQDQSEKIFTCFNIANQSQGTNAFNFSIQIQPLQQGQLKIFKGLNDFFYTSFQQTGFFQWNIAFNNQTQQPTQYCNSTMIAGGLAAINDDYIVFGMSVNNNLGVWRRNQQQFYQINISSYQSITSFILIPQLQSTNQINLIAISQNQCMILQSQNISSDFQLQNSTQMNVTFQVSYKQNFLYIRSNQTFILFSLQNQQLTYFLSGNPQSPDSQQYQSMYYYNNQIYEFYQNTMFISQLAQQQQQPSQLQYQLVKKSENINFYQTTTVDIINSMTLDPNYDGQLIVAGNDGSIRVYEVVDSDNLSFLQLFVQYHPSCSQNLVNQICNAANQITVSDLGYYYVIYKNPTAQFVTVWQRNPYSLTFISDYTLEISPTSTILNCLVQQNFLLIQNTNQLKIIDFQKQALLVNETYTSTQKLYYVTLDNLWGNNMIIYLYTDTLSIRPLTNKTAVFTNNYINIYGSTFYNQSFLKAQYYPQNKVLAFNLYFNIVVYNLTDFSNLMKSYTNANIHQLHNFCYNPATNASIYQEQFFKNIGVIQGNNVLYKQVITGFFTPYCGQTNQNIFYYFVTPNVNTVQNTVYVMVMPDFQTIHVLSFQQQITSLKVDEQKLILYVSFSNGDIFSTKIILNFTINLQNYSNVSQFFYSKNKKYFLMYSGYNIMVVDSLTLQLIKQFSTPNQSSYSLQFNEDLDIVILYQNNFIYQWQINSGQLQQYTTLHQTNITNCYVDDISYTDIYQWQPSKDIEKAFSFKMRVIGSQEKVTLKAQFLYDWTFIFEQRQITQLDRQQLLTQFVINTFNPEVQDLLVSYNLRQLIFWSDCSVGFCSPKVPIYSLDTGLYISEVPYDQQTQNGMIIRLMIDENTNSIVIFKDKVPKIIVIFDLFNLQIVGLFSHITDVYNFPLNNYILIEETANLIIYSGTSVESIQIEHLLSPQSRTKSILPNRIKKYQYFDNGQLYFFDSKSQSWLFNVQNNNLMNAVNTNSQMYSLNIKYFFFVNNYIYVIYINQIIKIDLNYQIVSAQKNEVDKSIMLDSSLLITDYSGNILQYDLNSLSQLGQTIKIGQRAYQILLISSHKQVFISTNKNTIYILNYISSTLVKWFNPTSDQIYKMYLDSQNNILFITMVSGQCFVFDKTAIQKSNSQNATQYSIQLSSSNSQIYQIAIEPVSGIFLSQIIPANTIPQINCYSYQFSDAQRLQLIGLSYYGSIPSFTRSADMKIQFIQSQIFIFTSYQLMIYNQDLRLANMLRTTILFTNLKKIILIPSPQKNVTLFFAEQENRISFYSYQINLIQLYTHSCITPHLIDYLLVQISYGFQVNILVLCDDRVINDEIYLQDMLTSLSQIQSCYTQSNSTLYYQFLQTLQKLDSSFQQQNANPQQVRIEQLQQTDFGPYQSSRLITYSQRNLDTSNLKDMIIVENSFLDYQFQELILQNFVFDMSVAQSSILFKFVNRFLISGAFLEQLYSSQQQSFLMIQGVKNITLQNIIFQDFSLLSFLVSNNFYFVEDTQVLVEQNIANLYNISSSHSTKIYQSLIFFNYTDYVSIQNCQFQYIKCENCLGGVFQIYSGVSHKIFNSTAFQVTAQIGGALAILECPTCGITIQNCNFQNNQATIYGGAIYLQNSNVSIEQCFIQKNQAMIGGGIKYTQIKPIISENKIIRNLKYDDLYSNYSSLSADTDSDFRNLQKNQQLINNNIAQIYDIKNIQQNYDQQDVSDQFVLESYQLNNFRSGGSLNFQIQVLDEEGNPINFIPNQIKQMKYETLILNELLALSIKIGPLHNDKLKVFGQYTANFEQFNTETKSFVIQNMQIVSNPSSSNIVKITSDSLIKIDKTTRQIDLQNTNKLYSLLQVNTRACISGEVYLSVDLVYQCYECQQGTYFLNEPTLTDNVCIKCPQNAQQCKLNQIDLMQGYWRINKQSDRLILCSRNPSNCVPNEAKNYCVKGNYGPLCEQCDVYGNIWEEQYITDGNYNCYPCSELQNRPYYSLLTLNLSLMILFIIISVSLQLHFSRCIAASYYLRKMQLISISKSAFWNQSSFGLKSLVSFLQITGLIFAQLEFSFPFGTRLLSSTVGMPSTNLFYSLDCIFGKMQEMQIVYFRTLWSLFIPILYLIFIQVILVIYGFIKRRSAKILIINGATFLFFFTQNSIVYLLLRMMSCRQIDGILYINSDITYECFTKNHLKFMKYIGIPGLIGWVLIIPLFIFYKFYKKKKELDQVSFREKYGHLYNEYKSRYYYWDFIKSYKKLLTTAVLTLYVNPLDNKLIFGFLVQLAYIQILSRVKPHYNNQLYNIELFIELSLAGLLFTSILINQSSTPENSYPLYLLISISSFVESSMVIWISKEVFKVLSFSNYNKIKQKIISFLSFINIKNHKIIVVSNSIKHLFLWKKARKQLVGNNIFEYLNKISFQKEESKNLLSPQSLYNSQAVQHTFKLLSPQSQQGENMLSQYKQQNFERQFPNQQLTQSAFKLENSQKLQKSLTKLQQGQQQQQSISLVSSQVKLQQPINIFQQNQKVQQRFQQNQKEKFKLKLFRPQSNIYESQSIQNSQKNLFERNSINQNSAKIIEQSEIIENSKSLSNKNIKHTTEGIDNHFQNDKKSNQLLEQQELNQNLNDILQNSNIFQKQQHIPTNFQDDDQIEFMNHEEQPNQQLNINANQIFSQNQSQIIIKDDEGEDLQITEINQRERIKQVRIPANNYNDEVDSIED
ncbi:transmembrane protein, putative (macronuclear) [Tetrahymena thermophila SB210]|uniref:Transmembrane protein, putative n=1 Tax=Tetrahymena thermophila (strain SB210) TaxID=312017 RepID=Q23WU2_TETTS|nr:transmembrane protein, putative [Tetrahymena thermophila SB210]EAS01003.2 transmembrane protein, putative [Tetrahymena thermophila SB210]|eukprot:XP_001021248.2 transmembrane protein, putative [Tetrahymena thermophila SB210]